MLGRGASDEKRRYFYELLDPPRGYAMSKPRPICARPRPTPHLEASAARFVPLPARWPVMFWFPVAPGAWARPIRKGSYSTTKWAHPVELAPVHTARAAVTICTPSCGLCTMAALVLVADVSPTVPHARHPRHLPAAGVAMPRLCYRNRSPNWRRSSSTRSSGTSGSASALSRQLAAQRRSRRHGLKASIVWFKRAARGRRWAGRRLPSEADVRGATPRRAAGDRLKAKAAGAGIIGRCAADGFARQPRISPSTVQSTLRRAMRATAPSRCRQMVGRFWEWTRRFPC